MNIKNYRVLGLMSGTSLDGLDIAYCNFIYKNNKWEFKLICSEFVAYTISWKRKLTNLFYDVQNLNKIEFIRLIFRLYIYLHNANNNNNY